MVGHALRGLLGLRSPRRGRRLLDVLEPRLNVAGVVEQHLVQLAQRSGDLIQQRLTALESAEPVRLKQLPDVRLHLLLLDIQPALSALDPAHEVADRDAERRHDPRPPRLLARRPLRVGLDLR